MSDQEFEKNLNDLVELARNPEIVEETGKDTNVPTNEKQGNFR